MKLPPTASPAEGVTCSPFLPPPPCVLRAPVTWNPAALALYAGDSKDTVPGDLSGTGLFSALWVKSGEKEAL